MSKSLKKIVEESREKNLPEVDMCDRGISNLLDIPGLFTLSNITQLVLSHNKLTNIPPNVAELKNLEVLNVFNNQIEELPTQLSSLQKLKHLNLGWVLPSGCPAPPCLNTSFPSHLHPISPPPSSTGALKPGGALRGLDAVSVPPPVSGLILDKLATTSVWWGGGNLDLTGPKQVFKAENNPWVTPIADQFQLGVSHVFEYVRSETYKYLYGRHMQANPEPPKKNNDKSKKISRKPLAAKNK
uniref:Ras suppressor protein 1 n=1 Tax=Paramormyrops kingsleyae TaxID=1676925 RepID=A0A3B3RGN2_9TELE